MKKSQDVSGTTWAGVFIVNAVLLFLVPMLFPAIVVIGNASLTPVVAVILSSLIITLILSQAVKIIKKFKFGFSDQINTLAGMALINVVLLWILSRLANYTGFGITTFLVAVVLGLILTLVQTIVLGNYKS